MAFRSRTLPSDHPNMYAASRARPASFSPSAASSTGPTISEYVSSTPRRDGKCQQKEHRIDTSAERVAILNQRKAELEANGGLTQNVDARDKWIAVVNELVQIRTATIGPSVSNGPARPSYLPSPQRGTHTEHNQFAYTRTNTTSPASPPAGYGQPHGLSRASPPGGTRYGHGGGMQHMMQAPQPQQAQRPTILDRSFGAEQGGRSYSDGLDTPSQLLAHSALPLVPHGWHQSAGIPARTQPCNFASSYDSYSRPQSRAEAALSSAIAVAKGQWQTKGKKIFGGIANGVVSVINGGSMGELLGGRNSYSSEYATELPSVPPVAIQQIDSHLRDRARVLASSNKHIDHAVIHQYLNKGVEKITHVAKAHVDKQALACTQNEIYRLKKEAAQRLKEVKGHTHNDVHRVAAHEVQKIMNEAQARIEVVQNAAEAEVRQRMAVNTRQLTEEFRQRVDARKQEVAAQADIMVQRTTEMASGMARSLADDVVLERQVAAGGAAYPNSSVVPYTNGRGGGHRAHPHQQGHFLQQQPAYQSNGHASWAQQDYVSTLDISTESGHGQYCGGPMQTPVRTDPRQSMYGDARHPDDYTPPMSHSQYHPHPGGQPMSGHKQGTPPPSVVARRINFSNTFSEHATPHSGTMPGPRQGPGPHTPTPSRRLPGTTPARPPQNTPLGQRRMPNGPDGKAVFENVWHVGPSPGSQPVLCVDV